MARKIVKIEYADSIRKTHTKDEYNFYVKDLQELYDMTQNIDKTCHEIYVNNKLLSKIFDYLDVKFEKNFFKKVKGNFEKVIINS